MFLFTQDTYEIRHVDGKFNTHIVFNIHITAKVY